MARSSTQRKEAEMAANAADTKPFYSPDGTTIRVTHPDGSVALVGDEPRELPRKLWRAALREGCLTGSLKARDLKSEDTTNAGDEPFERRDAVKNAMEEAYDAIAQAEEDGKAEHADYEGSFTTAGIPNLRWLEKKLGFSLDASERDEIWAELKKEIDGEEDEEEEEGGE